MRILIADDSHVFRMLLLRALTKMGHEVVAATTGQEAWDAYQREKCPVLILDWEMPEADGLEVCRRVRAGQEEGYTYIIILTARKGTADCVEALSAGADDFITKPFDPAELEARLLVAARIVGLRRHVQQLERILPICMYCKKIRDSAGRWVAVESYISKRTAALCSHGYCPDCYRDRVEPELKALEAMSPPRVTPATP